jgi:pimeloyl-ACP methyl ester carboxylesterase
MSPLLVDAVARREVMVPLAHAALPGLLDLPEQPHGLVVFAHGSGSGYRSPRNAMVSEHLNQHGLATLRFDLLTTLEGEQRALVFDVRLLAERLRTATAWSAHQPGLGGLPLGYFGASTGAAAALVVAADRNASVRAVVSRGGRPDLAGDFLPRVTAPTLLIVGGRDDRVVGMNGEALEHLSGPKRLVIVPGATHLFEEPGALERVAELAAGWFGRFLPSSDVDAPRLHH